MDLKRLLALTILVPAAFVAGLVMLSYYPHQAGLFTHKQEHLFRSQWPHFGLRSMQERAASIGAAFNLGANPGKGTKVIVDIPVRAGNGWP
ncbi:MAG: hypothetical protein HYY01_02945 [Chloroflexi bacterium]|nr:hypothetical protein [Chloroflexota bacterium]